MSLLREKKKKQLAQKMQEAGIGKGVAGALSDETVNKVKKTASHLVSQAGKGIASSLTEPVAKSVGTGVGRKINNKGIAGLGVKAVNEGLSEARTGGLSSKVQSLKDAEENALKKKRK